MSDHQTANLILVLFDAVAFIAAALIARALRHFGGWRSVQPFRWGVGGVVLVTTFFVGVTMRVLSKMPAHPASDGVQEFNHGVGIGQVVGHAVAPGLIVLAIAWIVRRARKQDPAHRAS